jgi:NADPH2:quinone reductase
MPQTLPTPSDTAVGPYDAGVPTPPPDTHRRWQADRLGDPTEVLTLGTGPVPAPGPGETLVAVRASGVNFADGLVCEGTYQHPADPPLTPGIEVAGVVVGGELPPGCRPGDRVVGTTVPGHGGWAQYALARPAHLFPVADPVDDVTAAASHVVFQTAWVALAQRARLQPGEVVVVQGAGGATGGAAVQVARALGARVIAVAGGAAKTTAAAAAGADVVIDHRSADVVAAVLDATDGGGAQVAYDPVGAATLEASRRSLGTGGRLVVVGFASGGPPPQLAANKLLVRNHDVIGVAWPAWRDHDPAGVAAAQRAIDTHLAERTFVPQLAGVRPLDEAVDALTDLRAGTTVGKWVVVPPQDPAPQETALQEPAATA